MALALTVAEFLDSVKIFFGQGQQGNSFQGELVRQEWFHNFIKRNPKSNQGMNVVPRSTGNTNNGTR